MNTDDEIMKRLNPDKIERGTGIKQVDPSVRLGPLQGPINGEVPMEVTIGKPQAYKSNRYSKGMGNE